MTDFTALSARELAPYIQHTLIAVGTTRDETVAHAKEAVEYGFDAAMVAGSWVALDGGGGQRHGRHGRVRTRLPAPSGS